MKHTKHTKLKRPEIGNFHRNEFAFIGSNCKVLQKLMSDLSDRLSADLNICRIDEEHSADKHEHRFKIGSHRYDFDFDPYSSFIDQALVTQVADAVFINGNHFAADNQIVIIDQEKKESLKKRIQRLTNVIAVVLKDGSTEPFDFIQDLLTDKTPILKWNEQNKLKDILEKAMRNNSPELNGLVLAGGDSQRMGTDKSQLYFHGKPQELYLLDLFDNIGVTAFLSKKHPDAKDPKTITDTFTGLGPFGAICSAFRADPNKAYLVVACDLPYVDSDALKKLIAERDTSKIATCYQSENKEFPDPLLTIYEPSAYVRFLNFLSHGYSCPRKVLINSDVKKIRLENDEVLSNINTPGELESFKKRSDSRDVRSPNSLHQ
ncbi:MAG: NTP transferase domain-containing protein [Chitinophagales bacterium]|nr:NTP transferase domain-containing protein [Chitinophagales bacterium]